MVSKTISNSLRRAKIESFLDPEIAGIDETFWPDKKDFERMWSKLCGDNKIVVAACISASSIGDILLETHKRPGWIIDKLKRNSAVVEAVICARMCQLPSDTARTLFLQTLCRTAKSRQYFFEEIQKVIVTDRDHLQELASKLDVSGDGKREVLKEIVAYGMQVKKVEAEVRDETTDVLLSPAVMALADPRMAFNAIQELNKMDHEYGQDDKATSSIEGQAARIKRLRDIMQTAADKQAKVVGAVAKKVATRELKTLTNGLDND